MQRVTTSSGLKCTKQTKAQANIWVYQKLPNSGRVNCDVLMTKAQLIRVIFKHRVQTKQGLLQRHRGRNHQEESPPARLHLFTHQMKHGKSHYLCTQDPTAVIWSPTDSERAQMVTDDFPQCNGTICKRSTFTPNRCCWKYLELNQSGRVWFSGCLCGAGTELVSFSSLIEQEAEGRWYTKGCLSKW